MHIAILTDGIFPYVIGGMQKHSFYLAKYLARNSVRITLYHTPFLSQRTDEMASLACFTDEERKFITAELIDFPKFRAWPGHYVRESYAYSCLLYEKFRQNPEVDFIYAKGFTAWKFIEEKRIGTKLPPIGVKFHGMNMFDRVYSWRSMFEQWLLRPAAGFNLKHSDYVFSYGGKVTDILLNKAHIPLKRIIEIPTGIEKSWLNESPGTPSKVRKFIFIGRYDKIKGIKELTRSIRELLDLNFEFHFVGYIPEREKIDSAKVIYHNSISDAEEMKERLRNCDILICPSYSEGMPNVILEAMASGLAILATDVGAVNMLVSEFNGWLIDEPSTEKIKSGMISAINLPGNALIKMKENSVRKVKERFLWEEIGRQTVAKLSAAIAASSESI